MSKYTVTERSSDGWTDCEKFSYIAPAEQLLAQLRAQGRDVVLNRWDYYGKRSIRHDDGTWERVE